MQEASRAGFWDDAIRGSSALRMHKNIRITLFGSNLAAELLRPKLCGSRDGDGDLLSGRAVGADLARKVDRAGRVKLGLVHIGVAEPVDVRGREVRGDLGPRKSWLRLVLYRRT